MKVHHLCFKSTVWSSSNKHPYWMFSWFKGRLMSAQRVWSLRPAVQYLTLTCVCVCVILAEVQWKTVARNFQRGSGRVTNQANDVYMYFCWRTQGQGLNLPPAGFMRCMFSTGFTAWALFVFLFALKQIIGSFCKFPWKYTLGTSEQCQEFIFWNSVFGKKPFHSLHKKACRNMM